MRTHRFCGSLLIVSTVFVFLNVAMGFLARYPTWWGLLLTIGGMSGGFMVCASIWRDRL